MVGTLMPENRPTWWRVSYLGSPTQSRCGEMVTDHSWSLNLWLGLVSPGPVFHPCTLATGPGYSRVRKIRRRTHTSNPYPYTPRVNQWLCNNLHCHGPPPFTENSAATCSKSIQSLLPAGLPLRCRTQAALSSLDV
jgi:hypothetical protein